MINAALMSIETISSLETLLASQAVMVSNASIAPGQRDRLLDAAQKMFDSDSPRLASASLAKIAARTYGYLFRFKGDSPLIGRLVAPKKHAPETSFELSVHKDTPPQIVVLYKTYPECDHPLIHPFVRLSTLFTHISREDAFAEVQALEPEKPAHQLLTTLLGAAQVFAPKKPGPKP